jgi:hypothetical protein
LNVETLPRVGISLESQCNLRRRPAFQEIDIRFHTGADVIGADGIGDVGAIRLPFSQRTVRMFSEMPFDAKSVEDDLSDVKLEFLGMELGIHLLNLGLVAVLNLKG